jgi:hypothetical protein
MTTSLSHGYKGIPSLAGICTMERAMEPGLSVERCVSRLKRYHYAYKRLHEIFLKRLTAEPIYELKMAFSLHGHYCSEAVASLRKRVGEMREPPLGLDVVPDETLEIFFDEILGAPETYLLLNGIYCHALPALKRALVNHLKDTNPLADHPSVRVCRFALVEIEEMLNFGTQAVKALEDNATNDGMEFGWDGVREIFAGGAGGSRRARWDGRKKWKND